jgi:hypothetical protein
MSDSIECNKLVHEEAAENEGDEKEGRKEGNNLEKDKHISARSKLYLELDYFSQRESSTMAVLGIFPKFSSSIIKTAVCSPFTPFSSTSVPSICSGRYEFCEILMLPIPLADNGTNHGTKGVPGRVEGPEDTKAVYQHPLLRT